MNHALKKIKKAFSSKKFSNITMQTILQNMAAGKLFQEQLGISDDVMQCFFEASMHYVNNGEHQEAADCFLFMLLLNPLESTLWIKAGNAAHSLKRYDEALECYSMAMVCDADDPFPHLYTAQVYLELNELDKAEKCRTLCLRLIDENSEYSPLKQIALELKI